MAIVRGVGVPVGVVYEYHIHCFLGVFSRVGWSSGARVLARVGVFIARALCLESMYSKRKALVVQALLLPGCIQGGRGLQSLRMYGRSK